jgi:D-threo-aldose 1-dehydrogenase
MPELSMTRLGLGAASIGNHRWAMSDEDAWLLLEAAWECGIRHFDTAPHYGLGLSERRLGRFLRTKPRTDYVVSTKVGRLLEANPDGARRRDDEDFDVPATYRRVWDFTEAGVRRSLEESLERLGLDHVDVLYAHDPERWNLDRGLESGLTALAALRAEGRVRAIGVGSMVTETLLAGARTGTVDLIMAAGRLTLADQSLAAEVLPACRDHGVCVVAAAVFNGGLLAGHPTEQSTFDYAPVAPAMLQRTQRIEAVCASHEVPLAVAAMRFPLRHAEVRSVVVGAVDPSQVRSNADALTAPVPEDLWLELRSEGLVTA